MLGASGLSALSALSSFLQNKEEKMQIIFHKSFRIIL